jgi:hypothetical protein
MIDISLKDFRFIAAILFMEITAFTYERLFSPYDKAVDKEHNTPNILKILARLYGMIIYMFLFGDFSTLILVIFLAMTILEYPLNDFLLLPSIR